MIIADESFDGRSIQYLEHHGYKIFSIARECPGIPDMEVVEKALLLNGFIVTEDKDFGDVLVFRSPHFKVPALLIRLQGLSNGVKNEMLLNVLRTYSKELLNGFSVLTERKLRIRKLDNL